MAFIENSLSTIPYLFAVDFFTMKALIRDPPAEEISTVLEKEGWIVHHFWFYFGVNPSTKRTGDGGVGRRRRRWGGGAANVPIISWPSGGATPSWEGESTPGDRPETFWGLCSTGCTRPCMYPVCQWLASSCTTRSTASRSARRSPYLPRHAAARRRPPGAAPPEAGAPSPPRSCWPSSSCSLRFLRRVGLGRKQVGRGEWDGKGAEEVYLWAVWQHRRGKKLSAALLELHAACTKVTDRGDGGDIKRRHENGCRNELSTRKGEQLQKISHHA